MGEAERGEAAPRQASRTSAPTSTGRSSTFAVDAQIPDSWDCPSCGLPAELDSENPPPAPKIEPYKTHLAYVKERRSDAEAADILDEALQLLRSRRSPATSSSEAFADSARVSWTSHGEFAVGSRSSLVNQ